MAEVPPECYCLDDAQSAVYFCSARCLCIWSMLWATKPSLPEERTKLDLDLVMPGGARLHFMNLRNWLGGRLRTRLVTIPRIRGRTSGEHYNIGRPLALECR